MGWNGIYDILWYSAKTHRSGFSFHHDRTLISRLPWNHCEVWGKSSLLMYIDCWNIVIYPDIWCIYGISIWIIVDTSGWYWMVVMIHMFNLFQIPLKDGTSLGLNSRFQCLCHILLRKTEWRFKDGRGLNYVSLKATIVPMDWLPSQRLVLPHAFPQPFDSQEHLRGAAAVSEQCGHQWCVVCRQNGAERCIGQTPLMRIFRWRRE